ncbi:MAG: hypothetical protein GF308_13775 [Candidatus Heimdallarchaeota archaeon]|nr:hypothetical protein [Candidatus Heimdallarchaeota archaeon]
MSEELVNIASEYRDKIPELEGLLIGKLDGTQIWADTLTDLNHEFILSSASVVARAMKKLSQSIEKGEIKQIDCEVEKGFLTIVLSNKAMVIGFFGEDTRSQLAIIQKNLRMLMRKIDDII